MIGDYAGELWYFDAGEGYMLFKGMGYTELETQPPQKGVESSDDDNSSGGCSSSIGIGAIVIVSLIGAAFVFKKKG